MTITEDDARKKWCPFVRMAQGSWNRKWNTSGNQSGLGRTRCIASECMAWRWAKKPNPDYSRMQHWQAMQDYGHNPVQPMEIEDTTRGRCGLAGQP